MTMTYCRSCGNDVHITHKDEDCPADDADLRTPDDLKADAQPRAGYDNADYGGYDD